MMEILGNIGVFFIRFVSECYRVLLESSLYILVGIIVAGLLRGFLNPAFIIKHLGRGKVAPVIKASLLGVPLPL